MFPLKTSDLDRWDMVVALHDPGLTAKLPPCCHDAILPAALPEHLKRLCICRHVTSTIIAVFKMCFRGVNMSLPCLAQSREFEQLLVAIRSCLFPVFNGMHFPSGWDVLRMQLVVCRSQLIEVS
jgi:hypothetical protein